VKVEAADFGSTKDLVVDDIERVDIEEQIYAVFSDLTSERRMSDALRRRGAIAEFLSRLQKCGWTAVSGFGGREHAHNTLPRLGEQPQRLDAGRFFTY
jgi:hypothetical protein